MFMDGIFLGFDWDLNMGTYGEIIVKKNGFSININKPARFVMFSPECRNCTYRLVVVNGVPSKSNDLQSTTTVLSINL